MSRTGVPCAGPLSSYAISSTLVRIRWSAGAGAMVRRSGLGLVRASFPLAQIILGGARLRPRRLAVGIKLLLGDRDHAAVLAHLEHLEPLRGILEHPVFAFELRGDALDSALDAERLVAADAVKRLLLLEHAGGRGGGAEIELRPQRDHFLRTSGLAEPALHAGVFRKAQHRPLRIVAECASRASRHAGEAERAALDIKLDRAEGRTRRQSNHVDRSRRSAVQVAQSEPQHIALAPPRQEARRTRRALVLRDRAQRLAQRIRVVGFYGGDAPVAKTESGEDRLGAPHRPPQARDVMARLPPPP